MEPAGRKSDLFGRVDYGPCEGSGFRGNQLDLLAGFSSDLTYVSFSNLRIRSLKRGSSDSLARSQNIGRSQVISEP